jgi:hypothetical protein
VILNPDGCRWLASSVFSSVFRHDFATLPPVMDGYGVGNNVALVMY